MTDGFFPRPGRSALLVIDVQERMLAAMPPEVLPRLLKAHLALIEMARVFGIPTAWTEQYPKGLGPTEASLAAALADFPRVEKIEFSACGNEEFRSRILADLPADVILTGVETHVCVLQTALDLLREGRRVFIPIDAVASRSGEHRDNALAMLGKAGCVITNSETLEIFERLQKAEGEAFKRLSKAVK